MVTTMPSVAEGRATTSGAPRERETPATVRVCGLVLKTSRARTTLRSAFVGTALTLRGSRDSPGAPASVWAIAAGGEGAGDGVATGSGASATSGVPTK